MVFISEQQVLLMRFKFVEAQTKEMSHRNCVHVYLCHVYHVYLCVDAQTCQFPPTHAFPCVFHSVEMNFKYCLYFKFSRSDQRFGRNIFTHLFKI